MLTENEKNLLLNNLINKGLDENTIDYLIRYSNMSTDLFNIDHTKLINKLSNNIDKNISQPKILNMFSGPVGAYFDINKSIIISPKIKNKEHLDSIAFHEIDHAATTEISNNTLSNEDKQEYLNLYIQRLNNKFHIIHKVPFINTIIKKSIFNVLNAKNITSKGFNNPICKKVFGIDFTNLTEGITTYKQSKYEDYLNVKSKLTNESKAYQDAKNVATTLVKIVGEENVIKFEENNDVLSLKKCFEENTQHQLPFEDLIKQLNRTESAFGNKQRHKQNLQELCKKAILLKNTSDYNINLGNKNYSNEELEYLLKQHENQKKKETISPKFEINYGKIDYSKIDSKQPYVEQELDK